MEQLCDDRTNTAEMPGPRLSAKRIGERILLDRDRKIRRIHFLHGWTEQKVYARAATEFIVVRFWPRVFLVITPRGELERVHKNTDRNFALFAGRLARDPDQFSMPAMQRSHGGDQDAAAYAPRLQPRACYGSQYFHATL